MFKLLVLTVFLSMLTVGSTLPTRDFEENSVMSRNRRMINGTFPIGVVPWQVALMYQHRGRFRYGGAGSIISSYWVLTVAHCTCPTGPGDRTMDVVLSGSLSLQHGSFFYINETKCHPDYEYDKALEITINDVAVLRVTQPFTFNDTLYPIGLNKNMQLAGVTATAYGWGSMRSDGRGVSTHLRQVVMRIASQPVCNAFLEMTFKNRSVVSGTICADGLRNSYICYGDSGGSLVVNNTLVGLISWIYTDECGVAGYPGVFVDIRHFRNWILAESQYFSYTVDYNT